MNKTGRGKGRGGVSQGRAGAPAHERSGARAFTLPRGLADDADVIGDALENHFRFHEGDLTRVCDARLDARVNARIDSRAPEYPDFRAPDASEQEIWDYGDNDYASVSHPHGEALGPGARCVCVEREKNAKSAGHTRRSFYAGSARAC